MPCAGTIGRMNHRFLSAFVLLLPMFDRFGRLPIFSSVLQGVPPERGRRVALRSEDGWF